ncbi:MAG: Ribonuclease PH [Elusimicrobia bacterium ADurb.Bin231]|nr:MAG: Ribonuclease PH [Elusimicrobia bacterium ADurb.Bin231]
MRKDGRKADELRKIYIKKRYQKYADGSCFISFGDTKVLCAATIQETVPPHLVGSGTGWVSAEYSFLPRAGKRRTSRQRSFSAGRTHEIQRLIGRSLRSSVDLSLLGERSVMIDCDVIQADGGTRTTSINGAFIAMSEAFKKMMKLKMINSFPVKDFIAAVSVGIVNGKPLLDLCESEDNDAAVDMNIVMTGSGRFIEIQGTGEEYTFSDMQLRDLIALAKKGISKIVKIEKNAVKK